MLMPPLSEFKSLEEYNDYFMNVYQKQVVELDIDESLLWEEKEDIPVNNSNNDIDFSDLEDFLNEK